MAVAINKQSQYEAHMKAVPAKASVQVSKTGKTPSGEKATKLIKAEEETVGKPQVFKPNALCMIEVGGGQTIGLPNFSSVRIDVRLSLPCVKDDIEETYEFATEWVSKKIGEAVAEATGAK